MKAADLISINCGGVIFQTTRDTIANCVMLTSQYNNIAEDEILFLDKDPKVFHYVLEIMRGDLTFSEAPNKLKRRLYKLLDFLLMRDVVAGEIFFKVEPNCPRLKNKSIITRVNRYDDNIVILNIGALEGDVLDKIKLELGETKRTSSIKIELYIGNLSDPVFSEEYTEIEKVYILNLNLEFLRRCNEVKFQYRTRMKNTDMSYGHSYKDTITTYS